MYHIWRTITYNYILTYLLAPTTDRCQNKTAGDIGGSSRLCGKKKVPESFSPVPYLSPDISAAIYIAIAYILAVLGCNALLFIKNNAGSN